MYNNGISSTSYSSGIVRVYYDGQWGNVGAINGFGSNEATVVCQQLGYTGAAGYSYSLVQRYLVLFMCGLKQLCKYMYAVNVKTNQ